jgi:hypothetical protein
MLLFDLLGLAFPHGAQLPLHLSAAHGLRLNNRPHKSRLDDLSPRQDSGRIQE